MIGFILLFLTDSLFKNKKHLPDQHQRNRSSFNRESNFEIPFSDWWPLQTFLTLVKHSQFILWGEKKGVSAYSLQAAMEIPIYPAPCVRLAVRSCCLAHRRPLSWGLMTSGFCGRDHWVAVLSQKGEKHGGGKRARGFGNIQGDKCATGWIPICQRGSCSADCTQVCVSLKESPPITHLSVSGVKAVRMQGAPHTQNPFQLNDPVVAPRPSRREGALCGGAASEGRTCHQLSAKGHGASLLCYSRDRRTRA